MTAFPDAFAPDGWKEVPRPDTADSSRIWSKPLRVVGGEQSLVLLHYEPGAHYPLHPHSQSQQVLFLRGSMHDRVLHPDGQEDEDRYLPGDYTQYPVPVEREPWSVEGATMLLVAGRPGETTSPRKIVARDAMGPGNWRPAPGATTRALSGVWLKLLRRGDKGFSTYLVYYEPGGDSPIAGLAEPCQQLILQGSLEMAAVGPDGNPSTAAYDVGAFFERASDVKIACSSKNGCLMVVTG